MTKDEFIKEHLAFSNKRALRLLRNLGSDPDPTLGIRKISNQELAKDLVEYPEPSPIPEPFYFYIQAVLQAKKIREEMEAKKEAQELKAWKKAQEGKRKRGNGKHRSKV